MRNIKGSGLDFLRFWCTLKGMTMRCIHLSASAISTFGLTQGMVCLVDKTALPLLAGRKWHAHQAAPGRWYARSSRHERMHRFLMGCKPGDGKIVDHINGDSLDNRRGNLRIVDAKGNARNVRSHRDSTSEYRGVSRYGDRGLWVVQVWDGKKQRRFEGFNNEHDAGRTARILRGILHV